MRVREIEEGDRTWAADRLCERWGAVESVSRGVVHRADRLLGFVAERNGERVGLATYCVQGDSIELVTLDSWTPGAGTALLEAVMARGREAGCRRLWLITTNDNTRALRFYQRRGLRLVAVHRDAIEVSRRLKPTISLVGQDGIPIRDEIELEVDLT